MGRRLLATGCFDGSESKVPVTELLGKFALAYRHLLVKVLQPLVFEADLDSSKAPGHVYVFDVVPTDQGTGKRSGYRIAVVAVFAPEAPDVEAAGGFSR